LDLPGVRERVLEVLRELLQELDGLTRVENKPQRSTLVEKMKDIFG